MKRKVATKNLLDGETTIRELKGISEDEMLTAVGAGQRLIEAGEYKAATEVLAGLALYDPFCPAVWRSLEDLFRRNRQPQQANFFADLARAMA